MDGGESPGDERARGATDGGAAARVTVVGGGVVGLACAYYLAKGGGRVTVLERDRGGAGASSGNAGTVSAGHPPLNRPGRIRQALSQMTDPTSPLYVRPRWDPALWRWLLGFARYCTEAHVEHAMRVMAPLGKDTLGLFDQLIQEERIECGYRADGYFDACATDEGLSAARAEAAIIQRYGYGPELVDGDELRRREPAFGPRLLGGVYYPEAATLDPARFLARLADACRRRGVEVQEGVTVERVESRAGRVTGVRTSAGDVVGSDAVVLSTGPFSLRLAGKFGVRIPVQPGKGYHRDIDIGPNGAPRMRHACVLHESSVFCTPMDTVVRFAGTMEFSGINTALRVQRLRQLTRAARAAFPGLGTARPISEWCGLRPMSMDGLPIVGAVPGVDGLVVATGHGMLGLTLAPVTGEMVANLVLGGGDARLDPLSPARFG
jgi:D-amino-acid dehydrogenase